MSKIWTLLVDVREDHDGNAAVTMTLLDENRCWHWRATREMDRNLLGHQRRTTRRCFSSHSSSQEKVKDSMLQLAENLTRDLKLDDFLDASRLDDDSYLVIDTMVTSIPWDLVLFRGEFLASKLAVGLNIPIANESYFRKGYSGRLPRLRAGNKNTPVFLHVIANPHGDLRQTEHEAREIKALVTATPGIEYLPLDNPDVYEVLDAFGKGVRFLHYTGHVKPGEGLLLRKGGLLSIANIESRFPVSDDQVVFLNGCDALFGGDLDDDHDIFTSASVANAFLYAGAKAVIAPRSRISDDDACAAAIYIWRRLLSDRVSLGIAVRDYRRESIEKNPNAIGGYSYILYGSPAVIIDAQTVLEEMRVQSVSGHGIIPSNVKEHVIVKEAALDARGVIAPKHLFGALTRRWQLGKVFFTVLGQEYIETLVEIRRQLGCQQILDMPEQVQDVEFSSGTELLIEQIMKTSRDAQVEETDFLVVLGSLGDPEITGAIRNLGVWSWELDDLCEAAALSVDETQAVPAIFNPGGWVVRERFLKDFSVPSSLARTATIASEESIGPWDLFVALARTTGQVGKFLSGKRVPIPDSGAWDINAPLHWCQLDQLARASILVAAIEMADEDSQSISESHLVYALFREQRLGWEQLPSHARQWLETIHYNDQQWELLAKEILLERLLWPNA